MYGQDNWCRISEVPFEILDEISSKYIEICVFHAGIKFEEVLDFRACMHLLIDPRTNNLSNLACITRVPCLSILCFLWFMS